MIDRLVLAAFLVLVGALAAGVLVLVVVAVSGQL